MDGMMKKIITEKDLLRQILLLEQLANHKMITAKQLAKLIDTTERTVFSDLTYIRQQLPDGWQIEAASSGFALTHDGPLLMSQLWETFFPQSIGVSLMKALLFSSELRTQDILNQTGTSYETLRRHVTKLNKSLTDFSLRIRITNRMIRFEGSEINIRVFFHRLLLPYTHNNYFFEEYTIHESHYYHFLDRLAKAKLQIEVEQIYGTCWFFINTIRIKANCRIDSFEFQGDDPLYSLFQQPLSQLYQKEGVYLERSEHFFNFYCFLESWNYNNDWSATIQATLESYQTIYQKTTHFVGKLDRLLQLSLASDTQLIENLLLLLIKSQESAKLSELFGLEFHEIQRLNQPYSLPIEATIHDFLEEQTASQSEMSFPLWSTTTLLIQQAILQINPIRAKGYFVFQGEPAWKAYLLQELNDFLGARILLSAIEPGQLEALAKIEVDFILSNFPLEEVSVPVFYLSMVPTKNELNQVTELIQTYYLSYR
ncbi:helix-turn-helix domain-containing protein [Enterococcus sp. DIV1059_2]|uniref:helix-turn-helix domain-containing protein n=1 Tax=Enterococcus sp. DIV1059_2 TaxID=2774664 RepID=UPI003F25E19B